MKVNTSTKRATVFDVAKAAGVSKSTVSLVLTQSDKVSDTAKEKVLQAIEQTGYVYNREAASMRSRRSNLVAIVINDLTNPYSAQLAVGLEKNIRQMGMFSMLVNSGECVDTQAELVRNLKEYNVAAFIICPAPGTPSDFSNNLISQGFSVIHIMREIAGAIVPTVVPDNISGTWQSTKHLLEQGYKKVAFLGGNEKISDYHQRLAGYHKALAQFDVAAVEQYCVQSDTTRNGGRQALQQLLEQAKDIEAIVCFSDVVAYGAIEQMRIMGKTPGKDIAIVGFDDLQDSQLMSPALTSVKIDANKIGEAVCDLLKSDEVVSNAPTLVEVGLQIRQSSKC